MDKTVSQDYVVVLVMTLSGSENRPPLSWLRQMYHLFDRRYKKNLKQVYVTHPGFWFRVALWFLSPLMSSSVWNKIVYVHQVRDLFQHFIPTQLLLPEFVFRYDRQLNPAQYETGRSRKDEL